jgi:hypothetical protein
MTSKACTAVPSEEAQKALQAQLDTLPERVAAMREKLLEAAEEQDLNKLRAAIERNEVMPLFGSPGKRPRKFAEAIDFLKGQSFDCQGREIFSLLAAILEAPFVRQNRKPIDIFVWPAQAADTKLAATTPVAEIYRFVAFADIGKLDKRGLPPMHRVEIGADGTWHFFAVE